MIFLSLFILGFSSLVAQIVMTRELVVSFYGNEFFIGWLLFAWLFWVGIGSIIIKSSRKILLRLAVYCLSVIYWWRFYSFINLLDTIKQKLVYQRCRPNSGPYARGHVFFFCRGSVMPCLGHPVHCRV